MSGSGDAMEDEFDTVATWTAEVVAGLDDDVRIPAACRGSGSPGALRWLLDRLNPEPGDVFLDCGAGVGGPAAFAQAETGVRPLLTDPEAGACRAARSLFGLPALQADSRLPLATESIESGWSLGVLCTVDDQPLFLSEIRRVLSPQARFGFVVYCAARGELSMEAPEGNDFPTLDALDELLESASFRVQDSGWIEHFAEFPVGWEDAMQLVHSELERRHSNDPRWIRAEEQAGRMGALLAAGEVRGRLVFVEPC